MQSIRLAFRVLFKTPFVTAVAVLSLALGIGANSAIYSMFDQMLLRPLPVQDPDGLVNLSAPGPKPGSQSCSQAGNCETVFSYPMYRDLERQQTAFTGLVAHRAFGANIAVRGEPMTGEGMFVSGSYFPTLGLVPAVGRLLGPSDDDAIGAHPVAVLGYGFWTSNFGSDPNVLNQTVIVNGHPLTIVGVAPKDFAGTTLGSKPQVYVPITMRGELQNATNAYEQRRNYWVYVFGRLKSGVSIGQASASINSVYRPIINNVEAALQNGMSDQTLAQFRTREVLVEPGARGQSSVHREARTPLLLLFAVTGVVLLIACANIANLLLARGASRGMEMGVRLALGAARRQLLQQLLTESVLLALLGGAASLFVAKGTLVLINSLLPPDAAATLQFSLQPSVVVFAALVSIVTGILFGLFPALHSTRSDLVSVIRSNAGSISGGGRGAARFRATLVTAQISLAMALLISAGLFLKSLNNVTKIDLGVHVDDVITFGISPERNGYDAPRRQILLNRVEEELASIPGATDVTASLVPLMAGSNWTNTVRVQGFTSGPDVDANSHLNQVSAGYFRMLGIRLLSGREFTGGDRLGSERVAVVNQAFVDKFKLGRDAVGKFMSDGGDSLNVQIVGVVQNAKYSDVKDSMPPVYYTPWRQDERAGAMFFYVRSKLPPDQMMSAVRSRMKALDPTLPLEELKTMPQQIRESVFLDRLLSLLSASFAILATVLAAVGLYGVLAYTVAQRTREIGVRMALGANAKRVHGLVLRQVSVMTVIGALLGVAAALGIGRAAQSLLFGMQGHDPGVFALSVLALIVVALAAGYVPARRAASVDPMSALRQD